MRPTDAWMADAAARDLDWEEYVLFMDENVLRQTEQLAERDERIRRLVSALELFIEHERGHCGDDGHDVVHPCGVMERARAVLAEPAE